nr:DUF805 domain-containing protein [Leucobacter edaphi]
MGQPGAYQQPVSPAGPYPPPGPGEPFNGAISPDDLTRPLYGATFSQAVKRFFKSFAKFSGRASRSEYWWVALFTFLISLIPLTLYFGGAIILASTSASASSGYSGYDGTMSPATAPANGLGVTFFVLGGILLLIVSLGLLVPNLAITWRRLHDANFAGPFYFIALIPYVGGLVVLVFTILGSNPAGRRFDV